MVLVFVAGACVFGFGVLIGVSLTQSIIDKNLKDKNDY